MPEAPSRLKGRFRNGIWVPDEQRRPLAPWETQAGPQAPAGLLIDPDTQKPILPPVGPAPADLSPPPPRVVPPDPTDYEKWAEEEAARRRERAARPFLGILDAIGRAGSPGQPPPGVRPDALGAPKAALRAMGLMNPTQEEYETKMRPQQGGLAPKTMDVGVGLPPPPPEVLAQISPEVREFMGVGTRPSAEQIGIEDLATGGRLQVPESEKFGPVGNDPAAREKKIRQLENLKDIAEGLGGMGQVTTAAMLRSGVAPPGAQPASDITRRIEEERDTLTQDERDFLKHTFGVDLPDGTRRSRIEKLIGPLTQMRHAQTAATVSGVRHQEKMDLSRGKEQRSIRRSIVSKFNSDPSVRKVADIASGAQTVLDLINTGDAQAIKNAVVPLARLLGEKGALSDEDRKEIKMRLGITQRIEDWVNQKVAGGFTPEFVDSLKIMANTVKAQVTKVRARIAKERAGQEARASGIDEQEILDMILPYGPGEEESETPTRPPPAPTGQQQPIQMIDPESGTAWPIDPALEQEARKEGLIRPGESAPRK